MGEGWGEGSALNRFPRAVPYRPDAFLRSNAPSTIARTIARLASSTERTFTCRNFGPCPLKQTFGIV